LDDLVVSDEDEVEDPEGRGVNLISNSFSSPSGSNFLIFEVVDEE
jgi:hypothetical protein